MPIAGQGWELHVQRVMEQSLGAMVRTVGTYQVYHDGVAAAGKVTVDGIATPLAGLTAEARGPGQNEMPATAESPSRIRAGRYPLMTWGGSMYKTIGYRRDLETAAAMPGIGLGETGNRTAIIIHPGKDVFLSSIGCLNPFTSLEDESEIIAYPGSRRRVIAMIEDMKRFLGTFPAQGNRAIRKAAVVIEGEPGRRLHRSILWRARLGR